MPETINHSSWKYTRTTPQFPSTWVLKPSITHGIIPQNIYYKNNIYQICLFWYTLISKSATFTFSGVRGGGRGRGGRPLCLKISGQTLFSGQAQVAQNFWKIKNISIQWKMSGQILFFKASACCSKFWMIKNIYSIQWIQGTLCFSGQAQVAQKSLNVKAIFNTVKNFRATLFSGQVQVVQNSEW